MFGYVRPVLDRLDPEDKRRYKSAYCGLCHTLGKRHGVVARLTLNYDFTLLALLNYCVGGCCETSAFRCPIHPFRKPQKCLCGTELERTADQSMILIWYKLCDDVLDQGLLKSLPARVLRILLRRGYRTAASSLPEFDATVSENLLRLQALEAEHSPFLDRIADTFASILAAAADGDQHSAEHRAMKQLLYHLGRWIYLIDAWDDLKDDQKKKRYNPLDARFSGNAGDEREYIETTVTHSVHLIQAAANLLDFGEWKTTIENILFLALPTIQGAVMNGTWKDLKKQGRKTHERSV